MYIVTDLHSQPRNFYLNKSQKYILGELFERFALLN